MQPTLTRLQVGEFIYEQPALADDRIYLQARADPGSRLQIGAPGAPQDVSTSVSAQALRIALHRQRAGMIITAALAHHYARSRQCGSRRSSTICADQARRATFGSEWAETASRLFETGYARLQDLPRRPEGPERDLRNASYLALITIKGYGSRAGLESASRALDLSRRPGIAWEKCTGARSRAWRMQLRLSGHCSASRP